MLNFKKINDEINKCVLISVFKTKTKEIEDKIPDISNVVDKTQLTTVENTLVKKTDFNAHLKKINDNILNKGDIKALQELNQVFEDKNLVKQNHLLFNTLLKIFNSVKDTLNNNIYVQDWQSNGSSDIKKSYIRKVNSVNKRPRLDINNGRIRLEFKRNEHSKQNKADIPDETVNIYIVYELIDNDSGGDLSNFGIHNFLFDATVLKPGKDNKDFFTKSKYSGYGIGVSYPSF